MFEAILTIIISLNLNVTIVDEQTLQLPCDELTRLKSSEEFIRLEQKGVIHDLKIIHDDRMLEDIVIVPEVDPTIQHE